MKKNLFAILGLALVFGLVLTGCPTEADSAASSAGNSKLSAPSRAVMTQGTLPGAYHIFTFTLKDDKRYDVTYKLWAREKGSKTIFEILNTADWTAAGGGTTEEVYAKYLQFTTASWQGTPTDGFFSKGIPSQGGIVIPGPVYSYADATQQNIDTANTNENELVYYGYILASALNDDFARAPFQVGDDIEIGVQTVIDTATMDYLQKDIAVNPSDIKWFKSFKRR